MADEEQTQGQSGFRDAFDRSFQLFAILAAFAGVACYMLLGSDAVFRSLEEDTSLLAYMVPKLGAAVLIAGFIQILLPPNFFGRYMGEDAGLKGMAVATAAGAVTPRGPMTSFPLVTMLRDTGTGIGALVAYVTAWTTMGLQRVFMWEVPLMGAEFAIIRFVASMPLAIVAGLLARLFPPQPSNPAAEII